MIHAGAGSIAAMAAAGFVAAAVNAIAGGGTLLSFPLLLSLGYPALVANVSNTVGLLPGYAGGSVSYRRELTGQWRRMVPLGIAGAGGALAGSVLLTRTSPAVFRAVVPYFLIAACVMLAAQPVLARRLRTGTWSGTQHARNPLAASVVAGGVYGAFFGGALGVFLLGSLGLFASDPLQRLNALKGVLSGIINGVAAAYFVFLAPVSWTVIAAMAPAALIGGIVGAALARRLHPNALRVAVIAIGVAAAIRLLIG